ncbi:MAG: hypothetical protein ACR2LC_02485, partial [Pyrinomonadaceae bacterium]
LVKLVLIQTNARGMTQQARPMLRPEERLMMMDSERRENASPVERDGLNARFRHAQQIIVMDEARVHQDKG